MGKSKLASLDEAKQRIERIRAVHEMGRKARKLPSNLTLAQRAAKLGCKEGQLAVAWRMTHPEKGYSVKQLDDLCALVLKHKPTIGISHVEVLLAIPRPKRKKFQRRCVEENWSRRELIAAKVKCFSPKSTGGRRPQVTPDSAVVELKTHAHAYCRLFAQMRAAEEQPSILDGLPSDLRVHAKAARSAMAALRKAARANLEKTQEG